MGNKTAMKSLVMHHSHIKQIMKKSQPSFLGMLRNLTVTLKERLADETRIHEGFFTQPESLLHGKYHATGKVSCSRKELARRS